MVSRIYKEDHYTLLLTKYERSGPYGFGDFFMIFSHDTPQAWPVWTLGAWLTGFIKRTFIQIHVAIHKRGMGLVVLEKIIYVFPIVSLWELMTPGVGPFLTPGAWLAGFIKRTTIHCYTQNMKTLCLVVLEILCFSDDALRHGLYGPQGQNWQDYCTLLHRIYESPGPCGFGEEDFFLCFSHYKSMRVWMGYND